METLLGPKWRESHPPREVAFQPEHERYWRGYRLWHARKATWTELKQMSLDDVDLMCMLLDTLESGRPASDADDGTEVYV